MTDISGIRLHAQLISGPKLSTPKEVVSHLGAMQAQDYAMAKYAVGLRMKHATDNSIEDALNNGEIIRTHLLRPTWHFVTPEDLHWMLELTAPNILRLMSSSNRLLGLDEKSLEKSNGIIAKAIEGGNHFTRDELMKLLKSADLKTDEYRSSHFLMHAEMCGIIANGKRIGKQHTYTSFPKAGKNVKFTKDEALAELAKRYFKSHRPATAKDFTWWSGLSVSDAKKAIDLADLNHRSIDSCEYYFTGLNDQHTALDGNIHFLPAFDEFLIAYKDRSASISNESAKHAFTNNGIFRPIIVMDGKVIGTWKRSARKETLTVEAFLLQKTSQKVQRDLAKAARCYSDFMEMKLKFEILI